MKIGQRVYIKELDKIGEVTELHYDGRPKRAVIQSKRSLVEIDVLDKTVEAIGLITKLVRLIKSIFKKRSK